MMNQNFERKVSFDFTKSLASLASNVGCACTHVCLYTCISEMTLAALIGAGALNRANTVYYMQMV